MFVKNYYKTLAYSFNQKAPGFIASSGATCAYGASAVISTLMNKVYYSGCGTYWHSFGGVTFADGGVPPTFDDCKWSGNQVINFAETHNVTTSTENGVATVTGVYTLTNTTDADLTIKEVCLFMTAKAGTANCDILLDRTVLETPLVIPAGGIGKVTYTVQCNVPEEA